MTKEDRRTTRHQARSEEEIAQRQASHKAMSDAIWSGRIPFARDYQCRGCNRRAHAWHHQSYHPDDQLCVVPLCGSCHGRVHAGSLVLDFGVVPASIGLIRITIATAPELQP